MDTHHMLGLARRALERQGGRAAEVVERRLQEDQDLGDVREREAFKALGELAELGRRRCGRRRRWRACRRRARPCVALP
jgi:hypothetical protein